MFDRQFYPRLLASAPVDGSVAVRPVSRLLAGSPASPVLEPLVKEPILERGAVSDGDGPPPGGRDRRPGARDRGAASRREAAPAVEVDEAPAAGEATAVNVDTATETVSEGAIDIVADPALAGTDVEAAPPAVTEDLSGYGVYAASAPAAVPGMSRDELVSRYAHLVKYVVGRLGVSVPGLFDHEDAMQAGVVGLLRAIDAYKPESAASFESYAILRIRGSILDAVRSLDTVGRAGREAARAIQGAIRDLQHELGRSPTESEIAARLGLPVTRYRERLQAASVVTVSLDEHDARDEDDESAILADSAADPNAIDPAEDAARRDSIVSLIQEIGRLSERSRMVLSLYYQDEMTFKEIGQVLGVTESRVCQIHTEAILALRNRLVDPDVVARLGRRRVRS
jgi:RNA polymerase sigma factor for flagellar operon FliA